MADFTNRHNITFPLLADVGSSTIRRYGTLNTVVEEALGPNGKDPAVRGIDYLVPSACCQILQDG